jgi:hypothetical protein
VRSQSSKTVLLFLHPSQCLPEFGIEQSISPHPFKPSLISIVVAAKQVLPPMADCTGGFHARRRVVSRKSSNSEAFGLPANHQLRPAKSAGFLL